MNEKTKHETDNLTARQRQLKAKLEKIQREAREVESRLLAEQQRAKRQQAQRKREQAKLDRKQDARKKIIIGGALIAAMRVGRIEAGVIRGLLNEFVKQPRERELLGLDLTNQAGEGFDIRNVDASDEQVSNFDMTL